MPIATDPEIVVGKQTGGAMQLIGGDGLDCVFPLTQERAREYQNYISAGIAVQLACELL